MKLTYDPKHNIAYIRLRERKTQVETIRISEELNIDLSLDGTIYGIELTNANAVLANEDAGKLLFDNEATGAHAEMPLMEITQR